mmetsp:Transcript_7745/g.11177  ORF Transcript_7745/g.11177 Transcript_7745/m.11177 type:complete len:93 (+) Transcript_7745:110-388(+)
MLWAPTKYCPPDGLAIFLLGLLESADICISLPASGQEDGGLVGQLAFPWKNAAFLGWEQQQEPLARLAPVASNNSPTPLSLCGGSVNNPADG